MYEQLFNGYNYNILCLVTTEVAQNTGGLIVKLF